VTLTDKDLDAIKESKKQSRLWSLAMEGLQIQIGRYVLPVLNDLMSWVNEEGIPRLHALGAKVKDWLVPQLQKFGDWWETDGKKKWEDFTTWINDTLLPALEDFGRWVLDHGLSALQVMVQWIADHPNWAGPIIAGLLTIIATIKLTSLAFVFTPWGFVITMVFAVAAALVYAYQTNEDFRKSVDAMGRGLVLTWGWIVTTVSGAVAAVTGFLNALGINHTNLALVVNLALDKIIFAWGLFSRAVASVYQAHLVIFGLLKSAYDGLRLGIAFALAIIEMLWARFVQSVGRFIAQLAGPIRMLLGFAQTAATVITSVFAAALAIIEQITDRIGDLVGRIAGWLNTLMSGLAALTRLPGAIGIPVPGGNAFVPGGNAFVPVPALAAGGIIPGSPWGTLVRAGENNRAEAIVPLSKMGGTTQNTYNITVDVAPGADPVRAGAAVVDAIRSYERANGRGWRVAPA
jgi:hypothetical protein